MKRNESCYKGLLFDSRVMCVQAEGVGRPDDGRRRHNDRECRLMTTKAATSRKRYVDRRAARLATNQRSQRQNCRSHQTRARLNSSMCS